MYKLYSFDIFDTLVTRTTAVPTGVFSVMQTALKNERYKEIPQYIKDNFCKIRIESEKFARYENSLKGYEEVTFDEIYESIRKNYHLEQGMISQLKKLEIDTELKCLKPIHENINKIKKLVSENKKVILVSDIYHDKDTIRRFLTQFDAVFKTIPMFLSSEYRVGKYSGNLYSKVRELENVNPWEWHHLGDNQHSDVEMARSRGISAEHYDYYGLYGYEYKCVQENSEDPFVQLTIGTARNARLFKCHTEKEFFGASFGAVLLYPYISWLFYQAKKQNIKRLYFIARDGYVLKKMFDQLNKKYHTNIKTFYIYGSRVAWRIPSITKDEGTFDYIFAEDWNSKDMEMFLKHFGLEINDVIQLLPNEYKNKKRALKKKDLVVLKECLSNNAKFREIVVEKNKDKRKLIIKYLQQEINTFDDHFAFVDFTGSGVTQSCLANLMKSFYQKKIKNFYLRLSPSNFKLDNVIFYSMFLNLEYSHFFVESLVRAPHGQTIGYCRKGKKIVPVFDDLEVPAIHHWKIQEYINGIEYFTDLYTDIVNEFNLNPINFTVYCRYFKFILNEIDPYTAEILGSIPFASQNQIHDIRYLAPPYKNVSIFNLLFHNVHLDSEMPHVSRMRTPDQIMRKIDKYAGIRNDFKNFTKKMKNKMGKLFCKKKFKNNYFVSRYLFGILLVKKHVNSLYKKFYLLKLPIVQEYKFHVNGKKVKKITFFNLISRHRLYYKTIIDSIDKAHKYDHIYFFRHNIGEWYVFLKSLPTLVDKDHVTNPLIVTCEKKYVELSAFLCPHYNVMQVLLNYSEMDFFTTREMSVINSQHIHIPFRKKFEDFRLEFLQKSFSEKYLFSHYMCEKFGLDAHHLNFKLPSFSLKSKEMCQKKVQSAGLNINHFIFISTKARSIYPLPQMFWENIVIRLKNMGYDIYCNDDFTLSNGEKLKNVSLSFEEVCYLASLSKGIIALRSGLIDLFATIENVPMFVFYTYFPWTNSLDAADMMKIYTLKQFNHTGNIHEYDMDKNNAKKVSDHIFSELKK